MAKMPTRAIATKTRGSLVNGDVRCRFATPARANSRVFPALRDLAGDGKQHDANREKY
jgi:hypothetical protein